MVRLAPFFWLFVTSAAEAHTSAMVWAHRTDDDGGLRTSFILWVPPSIGAELEAVARACGYVTRPATVDDLRESFPVLEAKVDLGRGGRPEVRWDLSGHQVALVNLWVELSALQEEGWQPGPAARAYLATAL